MKIIQFPNKSILFIKLVLFKRCSDVELPINKETKNIIKNLRESILGVKGYYENTSLGLSANQIGYDKRIIIISRYPSILRLRKLFFDAMINPEILEYSQEKNIKWEGCLSEPEYVN